ncbi:MAG: purine-binding chemotaxis protein CheW [Candidatus Aureabacteria bacterium]|nr:purine-binding chemotaxis protein CheW [Candidatus Auribacterota bacterium]
MATMEKIISKAEAGKYLTFVLDKEEYGLEILKVREIMGLIKITPVPQTPTFLKGIINLRGKVIPVVDLRIKFGFPEMEHTKETCIIVVEVKKSEKNLSMGIVVDSVSEVIDIDEKDIDERPDFGTTIKARFISGIGKVGGGVKMLLNINEIFSDEEIVSIQKIEK